MQKIFTPENEIELVMVKGLLEAAQIPFYVQNDHFGGLYIGPQIEHFNQKAIMVAPEYATRGQEIIADFIATQQRAEPESNTSNERISILEKLRLLAEALLFCWIVPRKRLRKKAKGSSMSASEKKSLRADHCSSNNIDAPTPAQKQNREDKPWD